MNVKSSHAAQCVKSWIINMAADSILSIDKFEQQCVVIKGRLKYPRLEEHMETISIDQSLRNSAILEHRYLKNTNNLYKHAMKCDSQQQFRDILRPLWYILLKDSLITVLNLP